MAGLGDFTFHQTKVMQKTEVLDQTISFLSGSVFLFA
ncbi:hypothetical protein PMIT1327_01878 [Prochlorococcus marinus str. MIT 1327]|nr:hypothetical protein PMIT1327_01878 [Prochlorococcus marinus str. MIT 1327]